MYTKLELLDLLKAFFLVGNNYNKFERFFTLFKLLNFHFLGVFFRDLFAIFLKVLYINKTKYINANLWRILRLVLKTRFLALAIDLVSNKNLFKSFLKVRISNSYSCRLYINYNQFGK